MQSSKKLFDGPLAFPLLWNGENLPFLQTTSSDKSSFITVKTLELNAPNGPRRNALNKLFLNFICVYLPY